MDTCILTNPVHCGREISGDLSEERGMQTWIHIFQSRTKCGSNQFIVTAASVGRVHILSLGVWIWSKLVQSKT